MSTLASASLAADLRVALARAMRRIRAERSSDAITDAQFGVLAYLDCEGPQTPGALAEREHVQPPSMTRTIGHLVDAGLVTRETHPSDGRQILVALTEAGRAEIKETRRRRTAWLAARLAELDQHERDVLEEAVEILQKMGAR